MRLPSLGSSNATLRYVIAFRVVFEYAEISTTVLPPNTWR